MAYFELNDIQGNILRAYNFPAAVYTFVHVPDAGRGRDLLRELLPRVTDARRCPPPTSAATNVAVTAAGLRTLGVDTTRLPEAFTDPMRERARKRLGDTGVNDPDHWDHGNSDDAHLLVLLGSKEAGPLADAVTWLDKRMQSHGATCVYRQCVKALENQREHFGYADGFGQPAVEGVPGNRPGQGTPERDTRAWQDVKGGEFILGYADEDGESISGTDAWLLQNGSYMVYRKLRQDVKRFRDGVRAAARSYREATGTSMSEKSSFELMAALLVGRWRDGPAIEITKRRDRGGDLDDEAGHFSNDFRYGNDREGLICPRGAHVRRTNPRDLAGADGMAARRHRIIRRGMPYGEPYPDHGEARESDRGLIFICFNADLEQQFEVVQRQWAGDGDAFGLGDAQDYLLANRQGRFMVEGKPPLLIGADPCLVRTRGCEYLLMPGLRALDRLACGNHAGTEDLRPGEADAAGRVVELVTADMRDNWRSSRPVRRGQHPKSHGCVEAKFIVDDEVPEDLRCGLFADVGGVYDAWIRFSGSRSSLMSDARGDAHGMAVKVMGVPAPKVLRAERWETTQDFVMVNHDTFFCSNAAECAAFAETITPTGSVQGARLKLRVLAFYIKRRQLRGLRNLAAVVGKTVANPLEIQYWSQLPFALGEHPIKYSARPRHPATGHVEPPRTWDGLLDAVAASLKPAGALFTFEFLVQRQADPHTMPVDDATVPWSTDDSPYCRVATIEIQSQDILGQERRNFAEQLVFTPWHTRWEHIPLGDINRVRRAVYQASRELRHELNGVEYEEPGGKI